VLALGLAAPAAAQTARDPEPANSVSADLGVLRFEIDPTARVIVDDDLRDRVLSLSFWSQPDSLATQLRGAEAKGLASFSVVPLVGGAQRLDLRVTDAVRGTEVLRRSGGVLEVQFSSRLFAGAAVRVARRESLERSINKGEAPDLELQAILDESLSEAPEFLLVGPFYFPVGSTSPVREVADFTPHGRTWGRVPNVVRDAWATDPRVNDAVLLAETGKAFDAARSLHGYPTGDDAARTLLALARGWIWAQPGEGQLAPTSAGQAAEALQLAAALAPDAAWAPWARGRAAYHLEWEERYDEAMLMYRRAISAAPTDPERAYWEVGHGIALIGRGRLEEGITQVARWLGQAGPHEEDFRFEARRAVLYALWKLGEPERAARVLDLLRTRHPSRSTASKHVLHWAMLQMDAGRFAEALPNLATIERTAERRVMRERARWWTHEAALGTEDILEARRALRRLIELTPGSAIVPLAKVRLQALDLYSFELSDGLDEERSLTWPEFALVLEREALLWPHTVLELEALSMTAQILFSYGLLDEGLRLYSWIEARGDGVRGATAYDAVVCQFAPVAFRSLRTRGHTLAALGVWRKYLEGPGQRACVDPQMRTEAAAVALTSGLPDLALTWLGQSVAEGQRAVDDADYLLTMAHVYLREGRPEAARRTLRFIEAGELPAEASRFEEVWGDLLLAEGEPSEAARRFERSARAAKTPERKARVPSLRWRAGTAYLESDQPNKAEPELLFGLANGGTDRLAAGWLLVSQLRQARGEAGSTSSFAALNDRARGAWESTLEAADTALTHDPSAQQTRAAQWHRGSALVGLGRRAKANGVLKELATSPDAWGLLAKNLLGALKLDDALDERTTKR